MHAQLMKPLEIDEQGQVTFEVRAENASSVEVLGKGQGNGLGTTPIPLTQKLNGVWSVTTPPIRPGFHYYDMVIDGVPGTDLANHAYFGYRRWTSGLEVPDPDHDFYTARAEVPRGEVRMVYYDSITTGRTRRCLVYTPPGYDNSPDLRYPVLYLQHGAGESEVAWLQQGKVNFIMDNLIHEGLALPMLIVMDNGYAASPEAVNWYMPPYQASRFEKLLIDELIPLIESRFRAQTVPGARAIAGLSMGGQQAAMAVLRNAGTFTHLGMFSAGLPSTGVLNSTIASRLNQEMHLIWVGTGLQDEFLDSYILVARNGLLNQGIVHEYVAMDGTHEWQVWRKCLHRFAPLLFRGETKQLF